MRINWVQFQPGHVNVARLLIDNNANISAENSDQETPLHVSAANGMVLSLFLPSFLNSHLVRSFQFKDMKILRSCCSKTKRMWMHLVNMGVRHYIIPQWMVIILLLESIKSSFQIQFNLHGVQFKRKRKRCEAVDRKRCRFKCKAERWSHPSASGHFSRYAMKYSKLHEWLK